MKSAGGICSQHVKLIVPVLLLCIAVASLAFIIADAVLEAQAHSHRRRAEAQRSITAAVLDIAAPGTSPERAASRIGQLGSNLERLAREHTDDVAAARRLAGDGDVVGALESLLQVQHRLFAASSVPGSHRQLATSGLLWSVSARLHSAFNIARSWPADAAVRELVDAGAGSSLFTSFVTSPTLLPERVASEMQPLAQQCLLGTESGILAGVSSDVALDPREHAAVAKELDALQLAVAPTLAQVEHHRQESGRRDRAEYFTALAITLISFIVASAGAVLVLALLRSESVSLREQSVINSDFVCNDVRVKVSRHTLLAVDRILAALSVMLKSTPDGNTGQITRQLQRAVAPVALLRPFIPTVMFPQLSRTESRLNTSAPEKCVLNLETGLKRSASALLYVGLRSLNAADASLAGFSLFHHIVHICVRHFHGSVAQVSSTCITAVFSRALVGADDDDEHLEDGEVLAAHCAFAILSLATSAGEEDARPTSPQASAFPLPQITSADRGSVPPVSIAITSSLMLQGLLHYYASTQYGLVSEALLAATEIEPLNEVHNTSIVTDTTTNDLLADHFLTRPIEFLPSRGTVFSLVMEEPADDHPLREQILEEQSRIRERVLHWSKCWAKFEEVVSTEKPSYEAVEEAYRDLEAYKLICLGSEGDRAFTTAMQTLKRLMTSMGVSVGAVMDEE